MPALSNNNLSYLEIVDPTLAQYKLDTDYRPLALTHAVIEAHQDRSKKLCAHVQLYITKQWLASAMVDNCCDMPPLTLVPRCSVSLFTLAERMDHVCIPVVSTMWCTV